MTQTVQTAYQDGDELLSLREPNMEDLLSIAEMRTLTVHGMPILVSAQALDGYINNATSAIKSTGDMAEFLESKYSKEDVEKLYQHQIHRRIVGREFKISEVGEAEEVPASSLNLVVPKINLDTKIIEDAIDASEYDSLEGYLTYLPAGVDESETERTVIITGSTFRTFLNDIQREEGGLDMNSQISVYATMLTKLPDEDPTKKYGLMQMRALMQYGDVVSNKNLRLALTQMLKED